MSDDKTTFPYRNAAFLADLRESRDLGLVIDQARINELAALHDVPRAKLVADTPTGREAEKRRAKAESEKQAIDVQRQQHELARKAAETERMRADTAKARHLEHERQGAEEERQDRIAQKVQAATVERQARLDAAFLRNLTDANELGVIWDNVAEQAKQQGADVRLVWDRSTPIGAAAAKMRVRSLVKDDARRRAAQAKKVT